MPNDIDELELSPTQEAADFDNLHDEEMQADDMPTPFEKATFPVFEIFIGAIGVIWLAVSHFFMR